MMIILGTEKRSTNSWRSVECKFEKESGGCEQIEIICLLFKVIIIQERYYVIEFPWHDKALHRAETRYRTEVHFFVHFFTHTTVVETWTQNYTKDVGEAGFID